MNLLADGPGVDRCSRAGCEADATAAVNWRNPRIHSPDRVKVWLACAEHVEYLAAFLEARSFPVLVTNRGVAVERVPDTASVAVPPAAR